MTPLCLIITKTIDLFSRSRTSKIILESDSVIFRFVSFSLPSVFPVETLKDRYIGNRLFCFPREELGDGGKT